MQHIPTDFDSSHFGLTVLHESPIDMDHGEAVFEIEFRLKSRHEKLFIGLLDAAQLGVRPLSEHSGIGLSIDPFDGEVCDAVNGQGLVGYLERSPIELDTPHFLCLEFEKIKRIYIPKLTVGEEKILHPALHIPELKSLALAVGTSSADGGAVFENPHLMVTRRSIADY